MKSATLFKLTRRGSKLIPAWLLRFRLYSVYQIAFDSSAVATLEERRVRVAISWATADEMPKLDHLVSPDAVRVWDAESQRVAVARIDGSPVGVAWIASGTFCEQDLGTEFQLADDDAWLYASHVLGEYQRQGVYSHLLGFVIRELKSEGKRRILFGVSKGNVASSQAHGKFGAQRLGGVMSGRLFANINFSRHSGNIRRISAGPLSFGKNRLKFQVGRV